MQTVGGGMMRLGVVQFKDHSAANPTTLDPTTSENYFVAV
jgi:hypothetical protein